MALFGVLNREILQISSMTRRHETCGETRETKNKHICLYLHNLPLFFSSETQVVKLIQMYQPRRITIAVTIAVTITAAATATLPYKRSLFGRVKESS